MGGWVVGQGSSERGGRTLAWWGGWFREKCRGAARRAGMRWSDGWVGGRTRSPPAGVGGWSDETVTSRTGSTWANAAGPGTSRKASAYYVLLGGRG